MKQSLIQTKIIAVAMLLSACSQEDKYVPQGDSEILSQGIEITVSAADFVTDGAPDTRATDNGNTTTFDNGDRVGIIILDENSKPIYDNIPYKYKNGKWTFDSGNDDGKGECYYDPKATTFIVYYPYSQAADRVTDVDDLKTKFAPKFNQSNIEDYRSSDLMVWSSSSLPSPVKTLDAKLTHAFASILFSPTAYRLDDGKNTKCNIKVSDVSFTVGDNVYIPYQTTDGSLRCIFPSLTIGDIRCFYAFRGQTYGNTITISNTVKSNTRYTSAPEIISEIYSLDDAVIGDFYCKNSNNEGYLIPNDVVLTDGQKAACVGIVFWIGREAFEQDPLLKSKHSGCSHGLVVALQDAALNGSTNMNWSQNYANVQYWVYNSYNNSVNIRKADIMCGYSNTLALVAYNETKGVGNEYRVLPCDAIQQYSKNKQAPTNSSGWYFPSFMELKYMCWGQGQGQGTTGRNYLNTQIGVSGGSPFASDYYWSSTQGGDYDYHRSSWGVYFSNGVYGTYKGYRFFRVRPLLAF